MRILTIMLVGLVAGGWMMGSLLVVPAQKKLSAQEYTAVEQANTSFGKRYFPVIVILSIISLAILTYLVRADKSQMILVGISLVLMIVALGFTGSRMVPLNNKIDTWSVQNPPQNWQSVRNSWHANHRIRTGVAFTAFAVLSIALAQAASNTIKPSQQTMNHINSAARKNS